MLRAHPASHAGRWKPGEGQRLDGKTNGDNRSSRSIYCKNIPKGSANGETA